MNPATRVLLSFKDVVTNHCLHVWHQGDDEESSSGPASSSRAGGTASNGSTGSPQGFFNDNQVCPLHFACNLSSMRVQGGASFCAHQCPV